MVFLYLIFLIIFFPVVVWGYVDPGSVSIFLQVMFAFFLGGFLTFKNKVINGIKTVFHFIFQKKEKSSDDKPNNNED